MTKRQHLINVYTLAAECVANSETYTTCIAIDRLTGYRRRRVFSPETSLYQQVMLPPNDYWFPLRDCPTHEKQNIRVFLLLFMAEWVRTDYNADV